jgi:hypothetical protein
VVAALWVIAFVLALVWIELVTLTNHLKSQPKVDHERRPFS